jgi:hypothetical protein
MICEKKNIEITLISVEISMGTIMRGENKASTPPFLKFKKINK